MKFEEELDKLVKKELDGRIPETSSRVYNLITELKEKHCLDKQKVKEAIEKFTDVGHHFSDNRCICTSCKLIEELGL